MKSYTPAVTKRFLEAKENILGRRFEFGVKNDAQFALKLGITRQVFTQLGNPKYGRNVTIEMCCNMCKEFDINGDWLLNGKGDMYRIAKADIVKNERSISKRIDALEKALKKATTTKKK